MTDEEFIEYAYLKFLRRKADEPAKKACLEDLAKNELTRDQITASLVNSEEFERFNANSEFVPHGHFFSAVTSKEERDSFRNQSLPADTPTNIDFRFEKQWELLERFKPYLQTFPFPENQSDQYRYFLDNPAFGYADGIWLHCMLRTFTPKQIIEVGCGYSSCMTLDTNEHFLNPQAKLRFIEPYPELLEKLAGKDAATISLIPKRLQDAPIEIFASLEANDILFIDSSHVSKAGSDVNHALFRVLPILKPGVLIHFHDIYWPFEYPSEWIEEGRCWNEAYLLRAFLAHNEAYEVVLYPNSLYEKDIEWFKANAPLSLKVRGGSIWLRKH